MFCKLTIFVKFELIDSKMGMIVKDKTLYDVESK